MIEQETEEDFDNEEFPRVTRKIDIFEDLSEQFKINFKLEWKCNAPIIFFEGFRRKNDNKT